MVTYKVNYKYSFCWSSCSVESMLVCVQSSKSWNLELIKGHLNILGQDNCFGLFPMLYVIILLLFLGFLNPIEQVSEINYQYFRNSFDKFLNFARWSSLDTVVLDACNLSALSVICANICLFYLPLSGENTEYILTIHITHCFLSSYIMVISLVSYC